MKLHQTSAPNFFNFKPVRSFAYLASLALMTLPGLAGAQVRCGALVNSARVKGGAALTTDNLIGLAVSVGSREAVWFDCDEGPDAILDRRVIYQGNKNFANPGFTSSTRQAFQTEAKSGRIAKSGGATIARTSLKGARVTMRSADAPGAASFVAELEYNGQLQAVETRSETITPQGSYRPVSIRIDTPGGDSIIQYFNYGATLPLPEVIDIPEGGPNVIPEGPVLPPPPPQADQVTFEGDWGIPSFDFDSGYWPFGGADEPGGFPIQARIDVGAGFNVHASVTGEFTLDGGWSMAAAQASGTWGFDFGAELDTAVCFDVFIIDPMCTEIPYIPNFDYRARAEAAFNSYLLGSEVYLSDNVDGGRLLDYEIGGLPGIASAHITIDAYGSVDGTMTCEAITTSDGLTYTAEGGGNGIPASYDGYHSVAAYQEAINICGNLHLIPKVSLDVLGIYSWDLPLWDFKLPVICGPLDLDMSTSNLDFVGPPPPTYPGRSIGDWDNDGCTGLQDFLFLLDNWQLELEGIVVGLPDFLNLLDNWQLGPNCGGPPQPTPTPPVVIVNPGPVASS